MSTTTHFNLPKPDETADVDEEFIRLQGTLDLLDAILKSLQDLVNGKAATSHTHSIAQITDLATQLAAKMPASQTFKLDDLTDVSGADGAATGYLLIKSALGWVPSSPIAALGAHGHLISEITGLVDALAAKAGAATTTSALALKADADAVAAALVLKANASALAAAVDEQTQMVRKDAQTFSGAEQAQIATNLGIAPGQRGFVEVDTANGYGSTNTKIRRFSNVVANEGDDITYTDSETLGGSFTIEKDGIYSVSSTESFSGAGNAGISRNSTELSTGLASITNYSDRLAYAYNGASQASTYHWSGFLSAGDVIRAHSDGGGVTLATRTKFTIVRTG
ncbi:hypothetical protein [uncultured Hoeflea sp.]|uniref:hypothetical protein n=1 Tax=uncultured Hoeflea sp. TaxID=538666 RepID=UPI0030D8450E